MDPLSIAAGAVQIAAFCTQCTVNIVKWVGEVRTVDVRIRSFCEEVDALAATYESLEKSLQSPLLAEAARAAAKNPDGADLWLQLRRALADSKTTMARVNAVLCEINASRGIGRTIKKQLLESLHTGELSRLRQRIVFFNSNLSFPIQMMTVMLQFEQRDLSQENQRQLDSKIASIDFEMRRLIKALEISDQNSTLGSQTLVNSTFEERRKEAELRTFAYGFLSSASAVASVKAGSSMPSMPENPSFTNQGKSPVAPAHMSDERRTRIDTWIEDPRPAETPSSSGLGQPTDEASDLSDGEDDMDMWFVITRKHLANGQSKAEQNNFDGAEKCFRKALTLLAVHDFGDRLAHQPADVVHMLADSCLRQQKHDEAIALLMPVATMSDSVFPPSCLPASSKDGLTRREKANRLQALAANHLLGQTYLSKKEPNVADAFSLKAFKGRKKHLGLQHAKTLESVQLLVDIYRAQGDEEEAEAFEEFLQPIAPLPVQSAAIYSEPSVIIDHSTMAPTPISAPPVSPSPQPPSDSAPPLRSTNSRGWFRLPQRNSPGEMSRSPRNSFPDQATASRHATANDLTVAPNLATSTSPPDARLRAFSWPSSTSTPDDPVSQTEPAGTIDSFPSLERSLTSKSLEPTFVAIQQLCQEKKHGKAVNRAMSYLESYNTRQAQRLMLIRRDELEKNVRKSGTLGLSGTGHGYSPLHFFCEIGGSSSSGPTTMECVDEVDLLIRQGVDVNAVACQAGMPGRNPMSALQIAVRENHTKIVGILLKAPGIRVHVKDSDGYSPLLTACRKGYYGIVSLLLEAGAQALPADLPFTWHGNSLLHDAARHCDAELVALLLQRSEEATNLNLRDRWGWTPLTYAVMKRDITDLEERRKRSGQRRLRTVGLLLAAGASTNIVDEEGRSATDLAVLEEDADLMRVLEDHRAYYGGGSGGQAVGVGAQGGIGGGRRVELP